MVRTIRIKKLGADDRDLIDDCVETALSVYELASDPAGLVLIHEPHDLNGKIVHVA